MALMDISELDGIGLPEVAIQLPLVAALAAAAVVLGLVRTGYIARWVGPEIARTSSPNE